MNNTELLINSISKEFDAALISTRVSCRYLTGFPSTAGYVLITLDNSYFFADFRYIENARRCIKNMKVVMCKSLLSEVRRVCEKEGVKNLLLENDITVGQFSVIKKAMGDIHCCCTDELSSLLSDIRLIKKKEEITKIRQAQKISEMSLEHALRLINENITERELALEIEFFMRKNGAEKTAFDLIVVSGENSSMPHGVPSDKKIRRGDMITFDIGAVVDGYHSDMTRTVAYGTVSDKQKKIYDIVLKAQEKALAAIKSGVSCGEVDRAARNVIESAGFGENFGHATGHGVGMDIHEEPRVSCDVSQKLQSGMIITVEPGIYLPGEFGVRIEDIVSVTEDGCDNFTDFSKKLIVL